MEKIALYRKYRPNNFDNLIGQDHIKQTLINAIKGNQVAHAYIFTGPRGTGKTSTARLMAKALNCTELKDGFEPCDSCDFCKEITTGRLIDLIEIDAASNRGIDEVRDLNEKIKFAPSRSKYKVYIIDEVHMMTKEAFNALLKTLEEPPSHAFFILATTEIHKIPETIISRCQRFDFKRLSEKSIMTRLSYIAQIEKVEADDKALEAISRYVDGGMRDAIGLMEQLTSEGKLSFKNVQELLRISDHSLLDALFESLKNKDAKAGLKIVHVLHDQGSDLKQFMHEFIDRLRQVLLEAVNKGENAKIPLLIKIIDVFQEAYIKINNAAIPQLPLEIAIIKIAGNVKEVEVSDKVESPAPKTVEKTMEKVVIERDHKKIVEQPKVEKNENTEDNSVEIDLSLEELKKNWPRITERIKTPALRMSLRSGTPIKIVDQAVTLQFSTTFHKDKVMENEHRVELEAVIKDIFQQSVKIEAVVRDIEIKPVKEEETFVEAQNNAPDDSAVDQALEIFGGEMVD